MLNLKYMLQDFLLPEKLIYFYYKLRYKKPQSLQFEVHLTEHCNLNCKYCGHFSCIAEPEFVNVESLKKDFIQLSNICNQEVEYVALLGGEPLLHPQLQEIFCISRSAFPKSKIKLLTNGLLLLNQPASFWEACRENDIIILVTLYPVKLDWQQMMAVAKKNNVSIEFTFVEKEKTMHRLPLDFEGTKDYKLNFTRCKGGSCPTLWDGKLFACGRPAYIRHFNKHFSQNIQFTKADYIDINEAKSLKDIVDFLSRPMPFCRYCDFTRKNSNLRWDTTSKDISEWS